MDEEKRAYLKDNGYFLITDDFVLGFLLSTYRCSLSQAKEEVKNHNFRYARYVGSRNYQLKFYTEKYLTEHSVEELSQYDGHCVIVL